MYPVKIVIADDHPTVVDGLKNYFSDVAEIEVIATTHKPDAIFCLVKKQQAHVLLLDYSFGKEEQNGLDICKQLKIEAPELKIIVISSYDDPTLIKDFIKAGAKGYLTKTATKQEYIEAIKNVSVGGESFGKEVQDILLRDLQTTQRNDIQFTRTEKSILKLIAEGHATRNIAKLLCREKTTIDSHRKNILSKLQAMDKSGASPSKNISHYIAKLNLINKLQL